MSKPDEPNDRASSEEEADLRAYRRITDAMDRGDIEALAIALGQVPEPTWHAPASRSGRKQSDGWWGRFRRLTTRSQPRRQA